MRVQTGFMWLRNRKLPVEGGVCLQCVMSKHNRLKKDCALNVKVNCLCARMRIMGVKVQLRSFLTSTRDGDDGQLHYPTALPPVKQPSVPID